MVGTLSSEHPGVARPVSPSDLGELTGFGGTELPPEPDRLIADQRIYRGRGSEDTGLIR